MFIFYFKGSDDKFLHDTKKELVKKINTTNMAQTVDSTQPQQNLTSSVDDIPNRSQSTLVTADSSQSINVDRNSFRMQQFEIQTEPASNMTGRFKKK